MNSLPPYSSKKGKVQLPGGAQVSVNDCRVRVDIPAASNASIRAVSSATHNGGHRTFAASPVPATYLNYKVPPSYDGYNPSPQALFANFIQKEGLDINRTVGLLTAASMDTLSISSRGAQDVIVDVVVTAGLSNARSAGADADWFVLAEDVAEEHAGESSSNNANAHAYDEGNENDNSTNNKNIGGKGKTPTPPGTINTLVIVNTTLTESAAIEAYAIAIEAKCRAFAEHCMVCAKNATSLAQGTGTDCCVLMYPTMSIKEGGEGRQDQPKVIKHSGKHVLFAELIGQAVHEATSQAIMINIRHLHGHYVIYTIKRWFKAFLQIMKGARPCVPPHPMMPVPRAPVSVVMMGLCSVLLAYYSVPLPEKARLLLAAVAWDRYLGEPPLKLHPVCISGSAISAFLSRVPDRAYRSPVVGFCWGLALLVSMLAMLLPMRWFLQFLDVAAKHFSIQYTQSNLLPRLVELVVWILKLLLFKSTFSLQLLCTIALQMARFLERKQLGEARMQMSWLCSRDPSKLGSSELAGGTLESLAENLSDGFVAPLFWYVLLGPLGALAYRIINTLDSR